jgi:hypothetical protein
VNCSRRFSRLRANKLMILMHLRAINGTGRDTFGSDLTDNQGVQKMRIAIATVFSALLLGTALVPAFADDQPAANDPARHRMGDEGKLPATDSTTTRVPEMGAGTGESSGTDGRHRMGDEGKLPATGNTTTRVPEQGAGTQNPN